MTLSGFQDSPDPSDLPAIPKPARWKGETLVGLLFAAMIFLRPGFIQGNCFDFFASTWAAAGYHDWSTATDLAILVELGMLVAQLFFIGSWTALRNDSTLSNVARAFFGVMLIVLAYALRHTLYQTPSLARSAVNSFGVQLLMLLTISFVYAFTVFFVMTASTRSSFRIRYGSETANRSTFNVGLVLYFELMTVVAVTVLVLTRSHWNSYFWFPKLAIYPLLVGALLIVFSIWLGRLNLFLCLTKTKLSRKAIAARLVVATVAMIFLLAFGTRALDMMMRWWLRPYTYYDAFKIATLFWTGFTTTNFLAFGLMRNTGFRVERVEQIGE